MQANYLTSCSDDCNYNIITVNFFYSNGHLITRLSGGAIAVIMIGALLIAHKEWLVTQKLFKSEQIFLLVLGIYFAIKGNK